MLSAAYSEASAKYLYPPFKCLVLMRAAVIIFSLRYKFFYSDFKQTDTMSNLLGDFREPDHQLVHYCTATFLLTYPGACD